MTQTTHGHHILGTPLEENVPHKVVRCGGPKMCDVCACEAQMIYSARGMSFTHHYPHTHFKEKNRMTTKATITPVKFVRRPFEVEAIQVTEENFDAVAEWCQGKIVTVTPPEAGLFENPETQRHIAVEVARPLSRRQSEAYVGDWVLYAHKGFKVYSNRAFQKNFNEKLEELRVTSESAVVEVQNEALQYDTLSDLHR